MANSLSTYQLDKTGDEVKAALNAVAGKQDSESGKGLSTNDYTTAEKQKLAGIEAGAQVNTVTSVAGKTGAVALDKSDVGLGNADNTSDADKPISTAVQSALDKKADSSGMTTELAKKQDTLTFDTTPTASSTNPVTSGGVKSALDNKVDKASGKQLSTNDYTTAEKEKLAGIAEGATKVSVDEALSSTSENPVQNKAVQAGLDGKAAKSHTHAISEVTGLQDELDTLSADLTAATGMVGFARVNGDNDPAPSADFTYGTKAMLREIGRHMKMGIVKDGVLVKECAPGRITADINGDDIAIDGSEGDVVFYTDRPLELLKAQETVGGSEMNMVGVGLAPTFWQGHASKTIPSFGMTPSYTVNTKLDGDTRAQAHSIYNAAVAGNYQPASEGFNETFKASGNGYFNNYISAVASIQNAQNKNSDAGTNYPYMGLYYEFYELWIAMLYAEMGTLNACDYKKLGIGCTAVAATASNWADEDMSGSSGMKVILSDGTAKYCALFGQNTRVGASGSNRYNLTMLCGSTNYNFMEMLEPQRLLDAIVKAGLTAYVGNASAVFSYDDDGGMTVTADGSIDLATGGGMTAGKKYWQVRDVPGCEGLSDGVMTAVANCYVKMTFKDGLYYSDGTTSLDGATAVWKMSHPLYRGVSLALDGCFRHLAGIHDVIGNDGGTYYRTTYMAAKWEDMEPLTDTTIYGTKGTAFNMLRGLTVTSSAAPVTDFWAGKADWGKSLFCFTASGGGGSTKECAYTWKDAHCWGQGTNGQPADGYECVEASGCGCAAFYGGCASVRTLCCGYAASRGSDFYAGAFAVLLKSKNENN